MQEALPAFDSAMELADCPPDSPRWKELAGCCREKRDELWHQAEIIMRNYQESYHFAECSYTCRHRMDDQLELINRIESCAPDDPALSVPSSANSPSAPLKINMSDSL